jgi:hypothetical protein
LSLAVSGNTIFTGTEDDGIYFSTYNGTSWTAVDSGLANSTVLSLAVSDSIILAATDGGGIFLSANNGTNWAAINSGLKNTHVNCLTVSGSTIFAGTYYDGVWSRPISQVGVLNPKPQRVILSQSNFKVLTPSLANANATIEFTLPHSDRVAISIYNLSGHEIASLVNKNIGQGAYSIAWNTRNVAAGCYMVKMQAGTDTYVKSIPIVR